jgi:hypothetical protein
MTNGNKGPKTQDNKSPPRPSNRRNGHAKQDDHVTAAIDAVVNKRDKVKVLAEMEHEMLRLDFTSELDKQFKLTREGRLISGLFHDIELTGFFNGRIGFQFNRGLCGGFLDIPVKAAARLQRLVDEMAEQKRVIKLLNGDGSKWRREAIRKALEGNPAAVRLVEKAVEHVLGSASQVH